MQTCWRERSLDECGTGGASLAGALTLGLTLAGAPPLVRARAPAVEAQHLLAVHASPAHEP